MPTRPVRRGWSAARPASAPLALGLLVAACAPAERLAAPAPGAAPLRNTAATMPPVRISEFHYDNIGTDQNENIEVSFPIGTTLSEYRIVRYNGASASSAVVYTSPAISGNPTESLAGLTATTCPSGERAVVVLRYPADGLQNGNNDGFALVRTVAGVDQVVELLSYEGVLTASNGPAAGTVSTDVGVAQSNTTTPVGASIVRSTTNTWSAAVASSFGTCNDDVAGTPPPPPAVTVNVSTSASTLQTGGSVTLSASVLQGTTPVTPAPVISWTASSANGGAVTFTDASANPATATGATAGTVTVTATTTVNGQIYTGTTQLTVTAPPAPASSIRISEFHYDNEGTDVGERIEIEGDANTSLAGWSLVLYNRTPGSTSAQVYATIPLAGTLGTSCANGTRGVLSFAVPAATPLQNGANDGIALVNAQNQVVDRLAYEGGFTATEGPAAGLAFDDIGVSEPSDARAEFSLARAGDGTWYGPANETFGACNPSTPPAVVVTGFSFRGVDPLPVGFQELYSLRDRTTSTVLSGTTWRTANAQVATVDALGNVTATGVGETFVIGRATSGDTAAIRVSVVEFPPINAALYVDPLQFGRPLDQSAGDEFLVQRPTFTSSFNQFRGQPNWVAYNLDGAHRGSFDRCDCFTPEPQLPASFPVITSADYAGSGFSRGHMTMSADRTVGALDNATTFYFSNIIPQTSANNSGPWLQFEQYLGTLATQQNKELYIFAGGAAYGSATLNGAGRVAIPGRTWKVAVIMDRGRGIADVSSVNDLQVIAVDMPNTTTGLTNDWTQYRVSVDQVEALTGYDLLSALPDAIECRVEQGVLAPAAACVPEARLWTATGNLRTRVGSPLTVSTAGLDDLGDGPWRYELQWGDGTSVVATLSVLPTVQRPLLRARTWTAPGEYTVRLRLTDKNGNTGEQTLVVTVDP